MDLDKVSYKGFAWDHPAMVHWRKTHPVDPGVATKLMKSNGLLARLVGGFLIVFLVGLNNGLTHGKIEVSMAFSTILMGGVVILTLGAGLAERRELLAVSGAREFDKLLAWVTRELTLVQNNTGSEIRAFLEDSRCWESLCVVLAPMQLTKLAKMLMDRERVNRKERTLISLVELDMTKGHFRSAYEAFEQMGLVSGGFKRFFDEAAKELAKEEAERTG